MMFAMIFAMMMMVIFKMNMMMEEYQCAFIDVKLEETSGRRGAK